MRLAVVIALCGLAISGTILLVGRRHRLPAPRQPRLADLPERPGPAALLTDDGWPRSVPRPMKRIDAAYQNSRFGFSCQLLPGWTKEVPALHTVVLQLRSPLRHTNARVMVDPAPASDLSASVEQMWSIYRYNPGFRKLGDQALRVADREARQLDYRSGAGSGEIRSRRILLHGNGVLVELALDAPPAAFDEQLGIFQTLVESFAFSPPLHVPESLEAGRARHQTALQAQLDQLPLAPAPPPPPGWQACGYLSADRQLAAWLGEPQTGRTPPILVVYAHESVGPVSTADWDRAEQLRRGGCRVLVPTWRGEGNNGGRYELNYGEVDDLLAAARYLAGEGTERKVFASGFGVGGVTALLAAELSTQFQGVAIAHAVTDELAWYDHFVQSSSPLTPYEVQPLEQLLRSPARFLRELSCPVLTSAASRRTGHRWQAACLAAEGQRAGQDVRFAEIVPTVGLLKHIDELLIATHLDFFRELDSPPVR